jgi:hypothetical protein
MFTLAFLGYFESTSLNLRRARYPAMSSHRGEAQSRGRAGLAPSAKYADQIAAAARQSFLDGDEWAYTAGLVAIVLGALLVFLKFPRRDAGQEPLRRYHVEDSESAATEKPA